MGSHEEMNKELCMCCALALSSLWGVLEVIEAYEAQGVLSTSYPAQDPCQDPPTPTGASSSRRDRVAGCPCRRGSRDDVQGRAPLGRPQGLGFLRVCQCVCVSERLTTC